MQCGERQAKKNVEKVNQLLFVHYADKRAFEICGKNLAH